MYYIFNQNGEFIANCDFEPDETDLNSRQEFAIETKQSYTNPYFNGKTIIDRPLQPTQWHEWNGSEWVIDQTQKAKLKTQQQAEMWERIKQKRHDNLRGGVLVQSIGKWFHSNDESRQQYTFMRTLPQLPSGMTWKTMDNTFVPFTKAILDELSLQLIADEQADFANAERHKHLMEQEENPLDYDFSDGWTPTFTE